MIKHDDIYPELSSFEDEMEYLSDDSLCEIEDEILMSSEWLPRLDIHEYDDFCEYASKWY